jgi:hypothetical protein
VLYQVNGGDWTSAASTNSWTDWTANVMLQPGANTVQAYAVNAWGDASRTNVVRLFRK